MAEASLPPPSHASGHATLKHLACGSGSPVMFYHNFTPSHPPPPLTRAGHRGTLQGHPWLTQPITHNPTPTKTTAMSAALASRIAASKPQAARLRSATMSKPPRTLASATRRNAEIAVCAPPFIAVALSLTLFAGAAHAIGPCCDQGRINCRASVGRDDRCSWRDPLACVRNARRAAERGLCDSTYNDGSKCNEFCCETNTCDLSTTIPLPSIPINSLVFAPPPLCDKK